MNKIQATSNSVVGTQDSQGFRVLGAYSARRQVLELGYVQLLWLSSGDFEIDANKQPM